MIEVGVTASGLKKFESQLDKAMAQVEAKLSASFSEITREAFTLLVTNSPQWSGNFTSNWNYSVNAPNYGYQKIDGKDAPETDRKPFRRGMNPAVAKTLAKVSDLSQVSWRDKVFITNATPTDTGGSLLEGMEDGSVNLRAINLIDGRAALIQYTITVMNQKGRI